MRHAHTQTLYAYWDARRRGASAPTRADIAPRDLASLLGNLFILRRMDPAHHVFRLAGTSLCKMHRREFKDQNFLSLWQDFDRAHMTALLEGALSTPAPATAMAQAIALDGESVDVEISLLPLRGPEGQTDRILGLYQPMTRARHLERRPIIRHVLRELHPARTPTPSVECHLHAPRYYDTLLAANDH
ncbi:PAS domain-containing protein [Woodsholea maritima]|uniref:PAS domain-containing protein n=1 Tax=Woodsholea maritima TaxID=240237 RepID=UPI000370A400|nr:PAS domain-containing protein [Woodsholea maritima]